MTSPYNIGQKVFHITPSSDPGIILEGRQYLSDGTWQYLVATGYGTSYWCGEEELSEEKTII